MVFLAFFLAVLQGAMTKAPNVWKSKRESKGLPGPDHIVWRLCRTCALQKGDRLKKKKKGAKPEQSAAAERKTQILDGVRQKSQRGEKHTKRG